MIDKLRAAYWSSDRQTHTNMYSLLSQICSALVSGGLLALGLGVYGYGLWLIVLGSFLLVGGFWGFRTLYQMEKVWIANNE